MNDIEEKTTPFSRDAFAVYLDRWGDEFYVTGTAGYYGNDTIGFSSNAQYAVDDNLRVGARYDVRSAIDDALASNTHGVMLGEASYVFPEIDWELTAQAGVFLGEDKGIRVESRRYFGPTELTFFAYDTDGSAPHGGFRVFLPLPLYSEGRHSDWHAGVAPYFGYQYRTDSQLFGEVPLPGMDVGSVRQRLRPEYVRAHLDEMRRAAFLYLYGD